VTGPATGPAADRTALFDRVLQPEPGRTALLVVDMQRGFLDREYRITVVEDAVATLWPEIQQATLDIIRRAYGRVVSAKTILDVVAAW
jgi:nicotinamidase-related amidase